jgi:H+/gluconate symporter-like permease
MYEFIVIVSALAFLMFVAYRGFSVIIFAPVAALGAVLFTDPSLVPAMFTSVFMNSVAGFIKLYFPVFLLGAIFGKVIELSGFSKSIVSAVISLVGRDRAILSIVLVSIILTYGGVSVFVVVFAVYPFAAEMFRQSDIPKRLLPGTIALGAFAFTMDAMPGSPQIQNIIPSAFFQTNAWAAPWLGVVGSLFILAVGLVYLTWRRKQAAARNEGYGEGHLNEPEPFAGEVLPSPWIAILPLVAVGVLNRVFGAWIPHWYGNTHEMVPPGGGAPIVTEVSKVAAIWAVEAALLVGILTVLMFAFKTVSAKFAEGTRTAVSGTLLASMNTASEYGFGAVIALLPGFLIVSEALRAIPDPLVNQAITITTLAGITGSATGGLSIALAAMSDQFIAAANTYGIPMEVLHRVASMASGGMDTLPHNGAIITLLAVTGLTHRQAYGDIFVITIIKTVAVFVVIAFHYMTGLY